MPANLTIAALLTLGIDRLRDAPALRDASGLRKTPASQDALGLDEAPVPRATPALRDAATPLANRDADRSPPDLSPTAARDTTSDTSSHSHILDAELLLSHALAKTRTHLKTHPELIPSADQARTYATLLERRATGEPIAYILGYRDFWTLTLAVNPSVLVPRPETELLVERALTLGPKGPAKVADLGTGSGAIALALASERPQWTVTATDVSEDALRTARSNAASNGLERVEFLRGPWFTPLQNRRFDLIASNPPYIAENDAALINATLQHEPKNALASGPDGMSALQEIVRAAPDHLEPHGWLILEHGSDQAAAVAHELVVRGFGHVTSHRDLAGHWRLTEAQWD